MRKAASVVWHLSFSPLNSFNKTGAAIYFSARYAFLGLPFSQNNLDLSKMYQLLELY